MQDLSSFERMELMEEISQLLYFPMGRMDSLKIEESGYLEFIPEELMATLTSVQQLYINDCCYLKSFGGRPLTALKNLVIEKCKDLEFLPCPEDTEQYALLDNLCIGRSCDSLISLPLGFFPNLTSLSIWECANLESLSMPVGIHNKDLLKSLKSLLISDCPKFVLFLRVDCLLPT